MDTDPIPPFDAADREAVERLSHYPGELRQAANVDDAAARMLARLAPQRESGEPVRTLRLPRHIQHLQTSRPRWSSKAIWSGLAVATLALGAAGIRNYEDGLPSSKTHAAGRTYATGTAQRATVELADGTRVMLAPNTTLTLNAAFGDGSRAVTLAGHASFMVASNPDQPFTVAAGNSMTRVLGTTFEVRYYAGDAQAEVVVQDGRVAVNAVVVSARQVAIVGSDGAPIIMPDSTTDQEVGWTTGKLAFRRTPLRNVATELSRWYDVDVVIGEPALAGRHLTASFNASDSLDEVIYVLAHSLGVNIERKGRTLVIRKGQQSGIRIAPTPSELASNELSNSELSNSELANAGVGR